MCLGPPGHPGRSPDLLLGLGQRKQGPGDPSCPRGSGLGRGDIGPDGDWLGVLLSSESPLFLVIGLRGMCKGTSRPWPARPDHWGLLSVRLPWGHWVCLGRAWLLVHTHTPPRLPRPPEPSTPPERTPWPRTVGPTAHSNGVPHAWGSHGPQEAASSLPGPVEAPRPGDLEGDAWRGWRGCDSIVPWEGTGHPRG